MSKIYCSLLTLYLFCSVNATTVSGLIRSGKENKPLAFSSILLKGTTKGVSANKNGYYSISLDPGEYTLVCQFVGFTTV